MKINEPNELFSKIRKKITKNDIFTILIVLVIGIINNFSFFITEGIAPDALSSADFNIAGNWEIRLGRFGIKYINLLRYGLVNKFIIVLISLIFLALAAVVISRIFEIKNKTALTIIAAIIAVAPQFTETYFFIYCADAYAFAFLVSTLTIFFLKRAKNKKWNYLIACLCTVITCSMYQAYLGVILGLLMVYTISQLFKEQSIKSILSEMLKNIAIIEIGVVIYYVILKVILAILGLSLASYKGANSLGINTLKALPKSILQTYKDFYNFFFTNKIIRNSYYKRIQINLVLFIVSLIGLILNFVNMKVNRKILRIVLIIFAVVIFPIATSIMDLIAPTTTVNLVTGPGIITSVVLMIIIYSNLKNNSINNIVKYLCIVLITILTNSFIIENTYTYMNRQETYKNYYTVANDIYSKVTSMEEYTTDKKWLFSDVIKFKSNNLEKTNGFISHDNETWNNYNGILQNYRFFDKYLGIKIKICSKDEYDSIVKNNEFKNMPIYPNCGSIKIIDNIIVIKISDQVF